MVKNKNKIFGVVINSKELQLYQNIYCESQGIGLKCYDAEGNGFTEFSMIDSNKNILDELFGVDQLEKEFADVFSESIKKGKNIWKKLKYDNIIMFSVINIVDYNIEAVWVGIEIIKSSSYENSDNIFDTSSIHAPLDKDSSLNAVTLLDRLWAKLVDSLCNKSNVYKKLREVSEKEQKMKEELNRKETTTKVLQLLERDEDFESVVEEILKVVSEYLGIANAIMAKIHEEDSNIEIIGRWESDEENNNVKIEKELLMDLLEKNNDDSIIIIEPDAQDPQYKSIMQKYGIKSTIAVPIFLGKGPVIYAVFAEFRYDRYWDSHIVRFLFDVCKMIQNMMFKRISKNSLVSSYTALKEILNNLGSGIFVIDKKTRQILFSNDIITKMAGQDMVGKHCYDFHYDGFETTCKYCLPLKHKTYFLETYNEKEEEWREIKYNDIIWVDGREVSLCNVTDVTEKKKYQKKIEFQANNDFLTGLFNRMRCEDDLLKCVNDSINGRTQGALLFIDLDNFKNINDGLGHQYGDMLLKMVSVGLQQIEEIQNTCYRVGGDEFIIIIKPEVYENKEMIIDQVQKLFSRPWYLQDAEYYCTMSMGIVEFPQNGSDVNDLIKKADIAMYDAKKSGKNRYVLYNEGEDRSSYQKLDIEKNMRTAVAVGCHEFEVYIQPIVDVKSQKCIGGEALVRWNNQKLGFLSPADFIPLAEHLGLIAPIGEYVLRNACRTNRKWSSMGIDVRINVNLSIIQLLANNVVDVIKSIIEETGIKPENLVLEVTESLAINDMTRMKRIIKQIKQLGVKIALDDFGTGYSSLNYIKQMDLDIIKVDRTFIRDIVEDDYAKAFIKLIAELSEKLEVQVCVEGVEQKEQLDILEELNISMIQGYYFGKPMKISEFEEKYLNIN